MEEGRWRPDLRRLEQFPPSYDMTQDDYAEAWAWVHFLLRSQPERRDALRAFLADLRQEGQSAPISARLYRLVFNNVYWGSLKFSFNGAAKPLYKSFFIGLMCFDIQALPVHPGLVIHLLLVALLMILFPFSKLLHAPGVFFSPTRNQADNPRESRHQAAWAAQIEKN